MAGYSSSEIYGKSSYPEFFTFLKPNLSRKSYKSFLVIWIMDQTEIEIEIYIRLSFRVIVRG